MTRRGFVRQLSMNWLRLASRPLTHFQFAQQSTDLLAALHQHAKVVHLDLRLDNMIITDDGVCFIDFGSAMRIGETIDHSEMLQTLFQKMINTSKIQYILGEMLASGEVTNPTFYKAHGRLSPALDLFHLLLQISDPRSGPPELLPLIDYQDNSASAQRLEAFTDAVFRPSDPMQPQYETLRDVLQALNTLKSKRR